MSRPFQTFDDASAAGPRPERLAALRAEIARRGAQGFVVPRADEHQSEYAPACAERLAWLTGFTGSAGTAVVLAEGAALFTDGRYTLQAPMQVDAAAFEIVNIAETRLTDWVARRLPAGALLAFDPWLHTAEETERLRAAARKAGGDLVAVESNPVDAIWTDRPAPPSAPIVTHPEEFAGESAQDKFARIREALAAAGVDALVVSDPHNLAWAFNIRGGDVSHTPIALGYALFPRDGRPTLFLAGAKVAGEAARHLDALADRAEPAGLGEALAALGRAGARVRIDRATGAEALRAMVQEAGGAADVGDDPITLMKAVKNPVELEGARAAHRRDGVAVARFLAWFDREAPSGALTEIDAVEALERSRAETNALADISFPTISGAGPNGAIVHYRVSRTTNRRIAPGELFLIDSGGQYRDGTTDVTRTLSVGEPTQEMRDRYTRVLRGHVAISRAVFPKGVTGAQIDAFARAPLWEAGLDYDHGTGHGVGSFLSVHEGPQRISKLGHTPLEPGMILSNEPGYYKPGAFGVRIENLVVVEERAVPGAERPMLGFETLTFAPYDRKLIDKGLLAPDEIAWIDGYHARVFDKLAPSLDARSRAWLAEATAPL